MVLVLATALAVAAAIAMAATPAHAGEVGFYYRSGSSGGCGGGYYVPPPPVYHRQIYRQPAPQWGGGCGQQPYYQPAPQQWGPPVGYGYNGGYDYQPAPQQWGSPPGYGYNPQPPDTYRSTTTCRGNSCWQDSSATWNQPNGGRVRVNQSGPVPAPWQTQIYHW